MPQFLKNRLRDAAVILGLAAAFTFFGVYATEGPLWARFTMWVITMTVGGVSSQFIIPPIFERQLVGNNLTIQVIIAAVLVAFPVTASLVIFVGILGHWMPVQTIPIQYLYVLAVCIVLTLLGVLIGRATAAPEAVESANRQHPVETFLERLPIKYRGAELWAISSEDHYLRIHTDRGEELILMRLADAIRELSGANGLQTHRSWWVAKDGIADTKRDNGKLVLVLKSGTEAPVSRTFLSQARSAGLV